MREANGGRTTDKHGWTRDKEDVLIRVNPRFEEFTTDTCEFTTAVGLSAGETIFGIRRSKDLANSLRAELRDR